jgi:cytochrome c-type biogenesis protein CcmH/NrfF
LRDEVTLVIDSHVRGVRFHRTRAKSLLLAFAILAFVLQGALLSPSLYAQQTERGKELGQRVKCMCGGCNDSATGCNHTGGSFSGPCDTAKGMQKEIDERVARNESDDLTLQAFVQEYGPTALIVPPARGFNIAAWVTPVVVPLVAFVLVWVVVRRWRQKATLATASGPQIPAEFLARAKRETGRDYDE